MPDDSLRTISLTTLHELAVAVPGTRVESAAQVAAVAAAEAIAAEAAADVAFEAAATAEAAVAVASAAAARATAKASQVAAEALQAADAVAREIALEMPQVLHLDAAASAAAHRGLDRDLKEAQQAAAAKATAIAEATLVAAATAVAKIAEAVSAAAAVAAEAVFAAAAVAAAAAVDAETLIEGQLHDAYLAEPAIAMSYRRVEPLPIGTVGFEAPAQRGDRELDVFVARVAASRHDVRSALDRLRTLATVRARPGLDPTFEADVIGESASAVTASPPANGLLPAGPASLRLVDSGPRPALPQATDWSVTLIDGGSGIAICGELDMATVPFLAATFSNRRSDYSAGGTFVLDLQEMSLLDARGVRALADLSAQITSVGHKLEIKPSTSPGVILILSLAVLRGWLPHTFTESAVDGEPSAADWEI